MPSPADTQFAATYPLDAGFFGGEIRVQRGSLTGEPISGIAEWVDNEVLDGQVVRTSVRSRTYVIDATAYTVGGTAVEPRDGDVIHETLSGAALKFRVMSVAGKPAFEPDDADHVRWLVRTKQVS